MIASVLLPEYRNDRRQPNDGNSHERSNLGGQIVQRGTNSRQPFLLLGL